MCDIVFKLGQQWGIMVISLDLEKLQWIILSGASNDGGK